MPSTLRTELKKCNFDPETGKMAVQPGVGLQTPGKVRVITWDDPMLDQRFSNGWNNYDVPRFVASDKRYVYVVANDRRNGTYLLPIAKDVNYYLTSTEPVPYPEE